MGNPWNVLGWILVVGVSIPLAVLGFWLLRRGLARVAYVLSTLWLHYLSRNKPLEVGQVWRRRNWGGGERTYLLDTRFDSGRFGVRCGATSWGDTEDEFRHRIRRDRMWLETW